MMPIAPRFFAITGERQAVLFAFETPCYEVEAWERMAYGGINGLNAVSRSQWYREFYPYEWMRS